MRLFEGLPLAIAGSPVLVFLCAFALTTPAVLLTIRVCRRHGWVSKPRADRWHKGTPAFFGGVPLFAGFIALNALFIPWSNHQLWRVIGLASFMFVLGLIDDIHRLAPGHKLVAQLAGAMLLVLSGVVYPLRGSMTINIVVSIVWLVGITNAFNLLDNMDGLSPGIALISSVYLALFYMSNGHRDTAVMIAVAAGSMAAFLLFNFNPARIFMGDAGSLFIGFLLGATSILDVTHVSGVPAFVLAPAMVLAIPVFDTLFVSVTRRLRGQAISQGGTDHSSQRLVRMGLEERRAVLLLYGLSAVSGAIALFTRHLSSSAAPGLIGLWFFFLLLFGVHLFHDDGANEVHQPHASSPLLQRLLSRDTLVFLLDPLALVLSYYLAYVLRFSGRIPVSDQSLLLRSLPFVVALKLLSLWMCRAFRHSWWRGSVNDIYRVGFAVFTGEAMSILALTGLYRFNGFSRAMFVLDTIVTWAFLLIIRRSSSLFRDTICTWRNDTGTRRRVFILGTSERAEIALRFLHVQRIECAGFIDTNGGADLRRYIFGRPVLGRLDDLARLSEKHGIFEVILPDHEEIVLPNDDLRSLCRSRTLRVTKLGLYHDAIDDRSVKKIVKP